MNPPCHECIQGSIHKGQPQGTRQFLHGLDTYIIGNTTNPKAVIVIYSDVFGLPLPNNRLIADAYAKAGDYLVLLPDFFQGDPVPLRAADFLIPVDPSKVSSFSKYGNLLAAAPAFLLWLARHKDAPTNKTCMDFLAAVRRERRGVKVGMVGFCWGGRYALRAAREQNMIDVEGVRTPLVDAVVALHPSNLEFPEDVARPVVPVSIGWGLEDTGVKIEQKAKVEGIHDAERQAGRRMPELENRVYTPGRHGFAVRGNPDDALERKALEDSVTQVVDWFARFLV